MGGMMRNGWGGGMVVGWIFGILFLVLVVLAILALIRYLGKPAKDVRESSALEVLKTRYARGEINKDEFEAKRKDLSL